MHWVQYSCANCTSMNKIEIRLNCIRSSNKGRIRTIRPYDQEPEVWKPNETSRTLLYTYTDWEREDFICSLLHCAFEFHNFVHNVVVKFCCCSICFSSDFVSFHFYIAFSLAHGSVWMNRFDAFIATFTYSTRYISELTHTWYMVHGSCVLVRFILWYGHSLHNIYMDLLCTYIFVNVVN